MIKLERHPLPNYLNINKIKLIDDYKNNPDNRVWNHIEIKRALLASSNNKCAYCECCVTEESKYMEVDHYYPKNTHPDDVVKWDNLIPSCKRCNGNKGKHDTVTTPIIDPFAHDPKSHLYLELYRFYKKTSLGENTIVAVNLNDTDRLVRKRFEIGTTIIEQLELADANTSISKMKNHMKRILTECQKKSQYAATAATTLHASDYYKSIKNKLTEDGSWDEELEELHNNSLQIMLGKVLLS